MKRNSGWVLIALLVLCVCFLLMPIGHAGRSENNRVGDPALLGNGKPGGNTVALLPRTKPGPQTEQKLEPISIQAVGFAESAPASTFPAATRTVASNQPGPPEIEGGESEGHEINPLNTARGRTDLPGPSFDGALQSSLRPNEGVLKAAALPAPSLTFEGIAFTDGNSGAPPDTNGDVGPNDYVQSVNTKVRVFDKNGVPRGPVFTQSSLFRGIIYLSNRQACVRLTTRRLNNQAVAIIAVICFAQKEPCCKQRIRLPSAYSASALFCFSASRLTAFEDRYDAQYCIASINNVRTHSPAIAKSCLVCVLRVRAGTSLFPERKSHTKARTPSINALICVDRRSEAKSKFL